jgi:hypothetical protein
MTSSSLTAREQCLASSGNAAAPLEAVARLSSPVQRRRNLLVAPQPSPVCSLLLPAPHSSPICATEQADPRAPHLPAEARRQHQFAPGNKQIHDAFPDARVSQEPPRLDTSPQQPPCRSSPPPCRSITKTSLPPGAGAQRFVTPSPP